MPSLLAVGIDTSNSSYFLQDQKRALDLIHEDPDLKDLTTIEAPLFDLEIRGVPALQFMGDVVWR